jgi:hypothetical protein
MYVGRKFLRFRCATKLVLASDDLSKFSNYLINMYGIKR